MKKTIIILLLLCVAGTSQSLAAITQVPDIMSAPVVLYDEGNNIIGDGDYTVSVAFKDGNGSYLYTEEQNITVKNGVAHIVLGTGYAIGSAFTSPAGGLSYDVFNVDSDVSVEILVEGQASPQEITILASQPYSFISQYAVTVANDAITSNKIKDGTIKSEDLDETFLAEIMSKNSSGSATTGGAITEETVDGTISSKNVTVTSDIGLNNASGSTVYKVLQGLDNAIDTLREVDIKQTVTSMTSDTAASITQLNSTLNTHTNTSSSVHGVSGSVVGTSDSQTLTNKTLGSGTKVTSNMSVNSGIMIDGVDISDMKSDVDDSITDINTSVSQIQTITPFAYGEYSGLSGGSCAGYNIDTSRTLTYTKGSDSSYGCYFSTAPGDTNFYVVVTYYGEGYSSPVTIYQTHHKQSDGFSILAVSPSGIVMYPSKYDFVVFKQP